MSRIGVLTGSQPNVDALKAGLADLGHREGETFVIEHRNVEGRFERLPAAVESLVRMPVDVLVVGGSESVKAVMNATQQIPVVFTSVGDPLEQGFIASYAKPGRNVTGITNMVSDLTGKWLELLKEVRPRIASVAALWNPPQPAHRGLLKALESAAVSLRLQLRPLSIHTGDDLPAAFATIRRESIAGLTMLGSVVHFTNLRRIGELAQQARVPAVAWTTAFPAVGGLMSYGVSDQDQWRRAASYVDKILKGAKPADLPVEQPTKFELVINMKTAKQLDLTVPPSLLLRAAQVIE